MNILDKILAVKGVEVVAARAARSLDDLEREARAREPARSLAAALRRQIHDPRQRVRALAEIKRASPSAGPIRPGADVVAIGRDYAEHGAAAISVLTDRQFFDGALELLTAVRDAVAVPVLRKDFVIDPYQIVEARAAGADAVLLIVAALDDVQLAELMATAADHGLDALVEVHDEAEAARALALGVSVLGVNHRDLRSFTIDMELTARIAPMLPGEVVLVGESGIKTRADVERLGAAGAHAVLVGEALMRAPSPGAALDALIGEAP